MFDLTSKVIVITGGCGLLGAQFSLACRRNGAIVISLDLSTKENNEGLIQVSDNYYECRCDITNKSSIKKAVTFIKERFTYVDGLINNAANNPQPGDCKNTNVEFFNEDVWEDDLRVGLTGAFLITKYLSPMLKSNPRGASLIFISSDLGLIAPNQGLYLTNNLEQKYPPKKPISYSVVKAGVIGMGRYFSTYWPELNIRSNVVCPGGVKNNQPQDFLNRIESLIPLGRMADVNSYNSTIVWLLSDESVYVNGAIISVDGGRTSW